MKVKKMNVLGREIMTEILPEEIPTGIDTTEEEGEVEATAGVGVGAGAKRDCGTGIETEADNFAIVQALFDIHRQQLRVRVFPAVRF